MTLNKDKSTIGKEIRLHRILKHGCRLPLECVNYPKCRHSRKCTKECPDYKSFICKRRDRTPGACNGCDHYSSCRFDKYFYDATDAEIAYRQELIRLREGFNTSLEEIKRIGEIIVRPIKNGQSIEQVYLSHQDEIGVCIKTIYNYIAAGLFKEAGFDLIDLDLRRKVSRKVTRKRTNRFKEREDRSFFIGRSYNDFKEYIEIDKDAFIVEMDTVYNDISGPFIQTFKFLRYGFIYALYHTRKDKESMKKLSAILGDSFDIIDIFLTDRGSEFYGISDLEKELGFKVFYCDPMRSDQKGSLENKHEELRYILEKDRDLYEIGLVSQKALDLVLSHINSSPRKKLNKHSPIELMRFLDPELYARFKASGIKEITKDDIILRPYLLHDFQKK